MTKKEHVYAICCRPEVAGAVISGENVKTIEGYAVLNFDVASLVVSEVLKQEAHQLVGQAKRRATKIRLGISRRRHFQQFFSR